MITPSLPLPPLQPLRLPWLVAAGVEVAVLRLDLIDPLVSGNKWFKLRPWLELARQQGALGLISLGGPWSNHLHALAAAGQRMGLQTVGLLRGEPQATATTEDLQAMGMTLHWLGYGGYRARHQPGFWAPWQARYPGWLALPEGGACERGVQGCTDLKALALDQLATLGWDTFDGWWLAAGTGTTVAGLVRAEGGQRRVHGALAVPPGQGAERTVESLVGQGGVEWHDASRGGFAKVDPVLLQFLHETEAYSGIPLEPVYTAKALLALQAKVAAGYFKAGTRLVFVHTGGLQGRRGFLSKPDTLKSHILGR
ncbi:MULTISPECIES: 1-aminocyclopropane-1-carboxylate deaminase/D-cysteine desulfhydrase [Pseudomonas]|uniref:1-aminocyclopropane-1-carboxylate deaminase n=1 Tax=Pseudomonas quercus TaxID=2722792 RepID=A0ABX0Y7W9_9PSED|nr:pyridoxal-phosphate dependent enzyme [Pseudomonas sp. LY10J]MBF7140855.1 1-aminocyclopropane-1-carboxylate deaminase [Pseudomonas sp. LY10J]NJO99389.1 1-aminocyclopropane-1-carboxylate deaminase [Pseudomonas quercus]